MLDVFIIIAIFTIKHQDGISIEFLKAQHTYIYTNVIGLLVINFGDILVQILNLTKVFNDNTENIIIQYVNIAFSAILIWSSVAVVIIDTRIRHEKLNFELEELMYV